MVTNIFGEARRLLSECLSVRLSICPSVTIVSQA